MQRYVIYPLFVFASLVGIGFLIMRSAPAVDAVGVGCCLCTTGFTTECRPLNPGEAGGFCEFRMSGGIKADTCRSVACNDEVGLLPIAYCASSKIQPEGECWKCNRSRDESYAGDDTVYPEGTFCYQKTTDSPPDFIANVYSQVCQAVPCAAEPACLGGSTAERTLSADRIVRFMPNITLPFIKGDKGQLLFEAGQEIDITAETLPQYIAGVFQFLVGIAALLAVIMIMIGGYRWGMARGAEEGISGAKSMVVNSLTGLALALVSYIVLQTISPGLVNLRGFRPQYVKPIALAVRETESVDPGNPQCNENEPCGMGKNEVPLFKQGQKPWRDMNFGRCPWPLPKRELESYKTTFGKDPTPPTYAYAGCGAMSVAMVLQKYGDKKATPVAVGDAIVDSKSRICGQGSDVAGFVTKRKIGKVLGAGEIEEVINLLQAGMPVIAHVGCIRREKKSDTCLEKWQGIYTGHYIVLTAVEGEKDNETIFVNDSAGGNITEIKRKDLEKGILRFIVIDEHARL